ncbi:hypothetical protein LSTR_LSTR010443 [Laodelphax striatellus]|uniref:Carboxylesterase type B domain-containing protein n=1 Tax=Laodelphax striatellus TaxID=195883 RepID=A0A482WV47_LAOST|nr:hypothetical protein LSTR_LSTR010443 [Laodelphax striatellus]
MLHFVLWLVLVVAPALGADKVPPKDYGIPKNLGTDLNIYRRRFAGHTREEFDQSLYELVHTSTGDLVGSAFEIIEDEIYHAWTDIPYAHPPLGFRRYQPPDGSYKWEGVRNVTAIMPTRCLQYNFLSVEQNRLEGSEEACLMLSVYRYFGVYHELLSGGHGQQETGPVIVLLHPGTYMYDFPFDGRRFAANLCCDFFIPVVVNYRLGPLGFLGTKPRTSAGSKVVGGIRPNLGLLDQVAALKWIQANIRAFSGNPDQVTLVGVAAGAAAVHLHQLSPYSRGLFHHAVAFGGSALVPWALAGRISEKTFLFGFSMMHCRNDTIEQMVTCMRQPYRLQSYEKVLRPLSIGLFYDWQNTPISPLGPVVDYDFLPDDPWILLKAKAVNKVRTLFSFTESAGLLPAAHLYETPQITREVNFDWEKLAPSILDYKGRMYEGLYEEFANRTLTYYFNRVILHKYDRRLTDDRFKNFLKMLTDRLYTTGIVEGARLHGAIRNEEDVFLYKFSVQGSFSFSQKLFYGLRLLWGPPVGDDFMTFIANQYDLRNKNEKKLRSAMTALFLSFCSPRGPRGRVKLPGYWFNETYFNDSNARTDLIDVNHYWLSKDPEEQEVKNNSYVGRVVTYGQVVSFKKYKMTFSNNVGNSRYWRRAPIIHPTQNAYNTIWCCESKSNHY